MTHNQTTEPKWTIRRAVLIGAALFFAAVIWRGMTLETETAAIAVGAGIWALVASLSVYALGVSAEQLIKLMSLWRGQVLKGRAQALETKN